MSTTFTVTIDSASNLDHLRAMAAMRAEKFFEKTPFEITEVKAAPRERGHAAWLRPLER